MKAVSCDEVEKSLAKYKLPSDKKYFDKYWKDVELEELSKSFLK